LVVSGDRVGRVGLPVSFNAGVTDGTPIVGGVAWDFGDGTTTTALQGSIAHVYASAGLKFVRASVVGRAGQRGYATVEIVIAP
jgi:PKD repeat protein